jgi:hypothetical protein
LAAYKWQRCRYLHVTHPADITAILRSVTPSLIPPASSYHSCTQGNVPPPNSANATHNADSRQTQYNAGRPTDVHRPRPEDHERHSPGPRSLFGTCPPGPPRTTAAVATGSTLTAYQYPFCPDGSTRSHAFVTPVPKVKKAKPAAAIKQHQRPASGPETHQARLLALKKVCPRSSARGWEPG